ncbi:MAG TPA: cupin domain-containing protein [Xanthobacteraceae bacterium]|nr:cupin domain-containing protein [Xanthobacteraceae bacterium]
MLSRRRFGACALCAAVGFAATAVEAQAQSAPAGAGFKRTILQKSEFPGDKYATLLVAVEVEPGAIIARHTHPGIETAVVIEGEFELAVKGQAAQALKAGDSYQVVAEVPHSARNGDKPTRIAVTYVVEKDKPLASPAPE